MSKTNKRKTANRNYDTVGRKPIPESERKVQLPIFVQQKFIDKVGGKEAAKTLALKAFLQAAEQIEDKNIGTENQ